ncbi:MAG: UDP-N-acetylmuramoyl-L-alanine--D-glutamate ligase [Eubacteriaceae bacterium]|nr:UDP-N-acetylmuramoyl-L-alanine--D-glutamate ligase [Eubacteriaceae bacterium]
MDYFNGYDNYLVIGAARSGIACARFLAERGKKVKLTDSKSLEKLLSEEDYGLAGIKDDPRIDFVFGRNPSDEEVARSGLVILSPGVPPDIRACVCAAEHGIEVISEVEFAVSFFKGDIVAITGTNGKTTTTYLTCALINAAGRHCFEAGNIGYPFIDHAGESADSVAALEISSFQLSMLKYMKPKAAVITNITPDHLDRHKTMENYIAAKANVFANMDEGTLILNYDDETVRNLASKARCDVKYFSLKSRDTDAYLEDGWICLKGIGRVAEASKLKILGPHNIANAMCALLCAAVYTDDMTKVSEALVAFSPVEHRVEFVRELDGVRYINDSKGTNPDATITAINSFECPLIMILGGYDKKSDYNEMFDLMQTKDIKHMFIMGVTAEDIIAVAEKHGMKNYTRVESLREAVEKSRQTASSGDVVLLSPACASWDMFDNFEQRGRLFKEYVNEL